MGDAGQARLVTALYNFKPKNTDELSFSKGDTITLTQTEEGGWWEGTLHDRTGWFPSNYVKDVKDSRTGAKSPLPHDPVLTKRQSTAFYHNVVLQSLIDTERSLVTELHSLLQHYLRPLNSANVISASEYSQLLGNLEEIGELHQSLLTALDACAKKPLQQQRIGGVFIKHASQLQNLYKGYCSNHPKAVQVLQKCKDELSTFMESAGASTPGIMKLTTSLSTPFTRLDKYPNLLKELERHTDQAHADRGDTQRAISVYKEIAVSCADIRKQKELEFELMSTPIKGWEGEAISSLGDVLLVSHVIVHIDNGEKRERLFVLFHGVLVMLSVTPHLSAYTYEGKLAVSGLSVTAVEENSPHTNAFEITGAMVDKRIVSCVSKSEQTQWIETLRKESKFTAKQSPKPQSLKIATSQPSVHQLSQSTASKARVVMRPAVSKHIWSLSCLRPAAPLRPMLVKEEGNRSPKSSRRLLTYRKKPVEDRKTLEEDSLILQVIEAYCTSAKARHTVNSSLLDSPQVLIAEEEKIIVEELKGTETVVEEKSLVDTVYQLRDQVKELRQEQERLKRDVEEGKRAHGRLETLVRKSVKTTADNTSVYIDSDTESHTV